MVFVDDGDDGHWDSRDVKEVVLVLHDGLDDEEKEVEGSRTKYRLSKVSPFDVLTVHVNKQ
jgi:hypothetical protein